MRLSEEARQHREIREACEAWCRAQDPPWDEPVVPGGGSAFGLFTSALNFAFLHGLVSGQEYCALLRCSRKANVEKHGLCCSKRGEGLPADHPVLAAWSGGDDAVETRAFHHRKLVLMLMGRGLRPPESCAGTPDDFLAAIEFALREGVLAGPEAESLRSAADQGAAEEHEQLRLEAMLNGWLRHVIDDPELTPAATDA